MCWSKISLGVGGKYLIFHNLYVFVCKCMKIFMFLVVFDLNFMRRVNKFWSGVSAGVVQLLERFYVLNILITHNELNLVNV